MAKSKKTGGAGSGKKGNVSTETLLSQLSASDVKVAKGLAEDHPKRPWGKSV